MQGAAVVNIKPLPWCAEVMVNAHESQGETVRCRGCNCIQYMQQKSL